MCICVDITRTEVRRLLVGKYYKSMCGAIGKRRYGVCSLESAASPVSAASVIVNAELVFPLIGFGESGIC